MECICCRPRSGFDILPDMARKKRIVIPNRCYHLVSRVAHQAFFFDDDEKGRFVDLMHRAAIFSGVRLLGWCIMSNHFHIFIYLPEETPLPDEQILERVKALYRGHQLDQVLTEWDALHKEAVDARDAGITCNSRFDDFKNRLCARMFHPGEFMKTLKQYVTTSFNGRRSHLGTLWENRYKVRISKPFVKDMSAQLAYVDCNPCEAGIVGDPADYHWCGWHAAVRGDEVAREMYRFVYCGETSWQGDGEPEMPWDDIADLHEQAIVERIGEISEAKTAGEELDWMFASKSDDDDSLEMRRCPVPVPANQYGHMPNKYRVQLKRGKGATAERIVAVVRAAGELSSGEILEAVGISSRSFLLSAYLKPMVEQGVLELSMPGKPTSRQQKYRIGEMGSDPSA